MKNTLVDWIEEEEYGCVKEGLYLRNDKDNRKPKSILIKNEEVTASYESIDGHLLYVDINKTNEVNYRIVGKLAVNNFGSLSVCKHLGVFESNGSFPIGNGINREGEIITEKDALYFAKIRELLGNGHTAIIAKAAAYYNIRKENKTGPKDWAQEVAEYFLRDTSDTPNTIGMLVNILEQMDWENEIAPMLEKIGLEPDDEVYYGDIATRVRHNGERMEFYIPEVRDYAFSQFFSFNTRFNSIINIGKAGNRTGTCAKGCIFKIGEAGDSTGSHAEICSFRIGEAGNSTGIFAEDCIFKIGEAGDSTGFGAKGCIFKIGEAGDSTGAYAEICSFKIGKTDGYTGLDAKRCSFKIGKKCSFKRGRDIFITK